MSHADRRLASISVPANLRGRCVVRYTTRHVLAVQGRVHRHRRAIEHRRVAREPRDDEFQIETGELLGGNRGATLHQHLQPHAKPFDIERFVGARRVKAPHIEVQNPPQLRRRGERDEFRGILEAARLNDAVKDFRLKVGDGFRQIGRIQQAIEQRTRYRHGTADLQASPLKKQS